jgi:hypothetical protein
MVAYLAPKAERVRFIANATVRKLYDNDRARSERFMKKTGALISSGSLPLRCSRHLNFPNSRTR